MFKSEDTVRYIALAALVISLAGFSVALYGRLKPNVLPSNQKEILVCTGEDPGECPVPAEKFFPCPNEPLEVYAAQLCPSKKATRQFINAHSGGRCGYSAFYLRCEN